MTSLHHRCLFGNRCLYNCEVQDYTECNHFETYLTEEKKQVLQFQDKGKLVRMLLDSEDVNLGNGGD